MDYGALLNNIFGLRGNLIGIEFSVGGRRLNALLPDDAIFFSIKDILVNREYEYLPRFELRNHGGIVVDVGAHAGLFSLVASTFSKRVYALEADERNNQLLSKNIAVNRLSNVVALRYALWHKDGIARFYHKANSQLGTLYPDGEENYTEVHSISMGGLLNLIRKNDGSAEIDFLKLDVEGAEFDILSNADAETLRRIRSIVAEIHLQHGNLLGLTEHLMQCGFNLVSFKRPLRKKPDAEISLHNNLKLLSILKILNLYLAITGYTDSSSRLLFATQEHFLS